MPVNHCDLIHLSQHCLIPRPLQIWHCPGHVSTSQHRDSLSHTPLGTSDETYPREKEVEVEDCWGKLSGDRTLALSQAALRPVKASRVHESCTAPQGGRSPFAISRQQGKELRSSTRRSRPCLTLSAERQADRTDQGPTPIQTVHTDDKRDGNIKKLSKTSGWVVCRKASSLARSTAWSQS